MKKAFIRSISFVCLLAVLMTALPSSVFAAGDNRYFPRYTGNSGSIVTALNSLGVNSSYAYRSKIAAANGIVGYRGSAYQNTTLVTLLKQGRLVNPDGKTTSSNGEIGERNCFPRYTGNSGSIVIALNSLGVNSSYAYRSKIAAANGIVGYRGSAYQNTMLVTLLKQGKLQRPEAVEEHRHIMKAVAGNDNVKITYCRCGYFETKKQGIVSQNSLALPNNGYIVSPAEIAAALAALKGSAAGIVSLVANPYVIIPVVVSGIALFAYVNCDGATAELVDVKRMSSNYRPRDLEAGKYYYSAIYRGKDYQTVMILYNEGMNLAEAKRYMTIVAEGTGILEAAVRGSTVSMGSVYTLQWSDAKKLCESLAKTGKFQYGGDRCANKDIGYNKNNMVRNVLYYEHYHLYYDRFGMKFFEKVNESHVFFGIPYTGYSEQTA